MVDVSCCPADVLSMIFKVVALVWPPLPVYPPTIAECDPCGFDLGWIQVTHVCRHWCAVGLDISPLWASAITTFNTVTISEEFLSRARECALKLETHYRLSRPMFDWVLGHMGRAAILLCDAYPPYIDHVENITRNAISHTESNVLRELRIRASPPSAMESPNVSTPQFIRVCAPQLLFADLTNTLPSLSSTLSNLRRLEVTLFLTTAIEADPDANTILQLLDSLQVMTRLKEFTIDVRRDGEEEAPALNISIEDAHMLCMEKMVVMSYPRTRQFALGLWEHLYIPNAITALFICYDATPSQITTRTHFERVLVRKPYDSLEVAPTRFRFYRPVLNDSFPMSQCTLKGLSFEMSLSPESQWGYTEEISAFTANVASALASISHCQLELGPFQLYESGRHQWAVLRTTLAQFTNTIKALGHALINVTLYLRLPDIANGDLVRLLAPAPERLTPFPSLHTLDVGCQRGRTRFGYSAHAMGALWDAITYALSKRKEAGYPVRRLEISDVRVVREEGEDLWAQMAVKCVMLGCVDGYGDKRTLI